MMWEQRDTRVERCLRSQVGRLIQKDLCRWGSWGACDACKVPTTAVDVCRYTLHLRRHSCVWGGSSRKMSAEPLTAKQSFRDHLPDLNTPRFQTAKQQSPYEYTQAFQDTHFPPWLYNLTEAWKDLLAEPFRGVTNDGNPQSRSALASIL